MSQNCKRKSTSSTPNDAGTQFGPSENIIPPDLNLLRSRLSNKKMSKQPKLHKQDTPRIDLAAASCEHIEEEQSQSLLTFSDTKPNLVMEESESNFSNNMIFGSNNQDESKEKEKNGGNCRNAEIANFSHAQNFDDLLEQEDNEATEVKASDNSHLPRSHVVSIRNLEGQPVEQISFASALLEIWCVGDLAQLKNFTNVRHSNPAALRTTLELLLEFLDGGNREISHEEVLLMLKMRPQDYFGFLIPGMYLTKYLLTTSLSNAVDMYKAIKATFNEKELQQRSVVGTQLSLDVIATTISEKYEDFCREIVKQLLCWKRVDYFKCRSLRLSLPEELKPSGTNEEPTMKNRVMNSLKKLLYFVAPENEASRFHRSISHDTKIKLFHGFLATFIENCLSKKPESLLLLLGKHSRELRVATIQVLSWREGSAECSLEAHASVVGNVSVDRFTQLEENNFSQEDMEAGINVLYEWYLCKWPIHHPTVITFPLYKFLSSITEGLGWKNLFKNQDIEDILTVQDPKTVMQIAIAINKQDVISHFAVNFSNYFSQKDEYDCFWYLSVGQVLDFVQCMEYDSYRKYLLLVYWTIGKESGVYNGKDELRCTKNMSRYFNFFREEIDFHDLEDHVDEIMDHGFLEYDDVVREYNS